ncbi:MAG: hypothetical protein HZC17_05025 [Candidatus Omnitrophica bacterium]|nr:hypothetical protein [Candidatus Omnitrophota bacterium]
MLIADIIFEKENTPSRKKESEKSFCHCVRGTLIKKKSVETPAGKHLVSVLQTYEERDYLSGELIAREENAITLYVFPPDEMVQKLESVGFAVEKIFGNYHQAPFDKNKSARMLIVARRS